MLSAGHVIAFMLGMVAGFFIKLIIKAAHEIKQEVAEMKEKFAE